MTWFEIRALNQAQLLYSFLTETDNPEETRFPAEQKR